jgi:hypothetical protein
MLFAVIGPSNTAGLPIWQAWLHWFFHVGTGLSLVLVVAVLCGRNVRLCTLPVWMFLLLTGLLGALLFAPVALWLEGWLPQSPDLDDDALDRWAAGAGVRPYIAEFLQLLPSYMLCWFLINTRPLLSMRGFWPLTRAEAATADRASRADAVEDASRVDRSDWTTATRESPAPMQVGPGNGAALDLADGDGIDAAQNERGEIHSDAYPVERNAQIESEGPAILERLPPAVGSEVMSASAELHYLEIVTTKGRATLLGRLSQLENEMGGIGLRIHRSHWVSLSHVRRVFRSQRGWLCELRDGRRLPIARRRLPEVQDRLGRDFVMNRAVE